VLALAEASASAAQATELTPSRPSGRLTERLAPMRGEISASSPPCKRLACTYVAATVGVLARTRRLHQMEPVELSPGLWRWTVAHPDWKPDAAADSSADWPREVGCVLVETGDAAVFVDAIAPAAKAAFWSWADRRCAARRVLALTTIGFHRRSRDELVERYGAATSRAKRNLPESVCAMPIRGAGETIFWLPEHRALVPGARIIGAEDGGLRTCPDSWLAYLPSRITSAELRELLRPLLELPIERVLVSHGEPVLADGHLTLAEALG
jgi:hypothetical protein